MNTIAGRYSHSRTKRDALLKVYATRNGATGISGADGPTGISVATADNCPSENGTSCAVGTYGPPSPSSSTADHFNPNPDGILEGASLVVDGAIAVSKDFLPIGVKAPDWLVSTLEGVSNEFAVTEIVVSGLDFANGDITLNRLIYNSSAVVLTTASGVLGPEAPVVVGISLAEAPTAASSYFSKMPSVDQVINYFYNLFLPSTPINTPNNLSGRKH